MELKQLFGQNKNHKFHPSWIAIIVVFTVLVGSTVWVIAWLVPDLGGKTDLSPSLSPTGPKIIMVARAEALS